MDFVFLRTRPAWWLVFLCSLLPFLWVPYQIFLGDLGADPGEALVDHFGYTAMIFLAITLALTPLKTTLEIKSALRFRRMLGLFALFFAVLHVLSYLLFIANLQSFVEDIYKRPYITIGMLAFTILLALGVTSPKCMVRKLGRKWKSLHRLVYLAAVLVVVHFWWQTRSDVFEPFVMAVIFACLLLLRSKPLTAWFRRVRAS